MDRTWRGRMVLLVCWWLLSGVGSVLAVEADPLVEAQMERFPRPIPLPEVSLPAVEGTQVSLRSFKGQVMLVNFWTTW